MFYKRRMTITCDDINLGRGWGGGVKGIRGRRVHCGNVQVKNNANCFLFQKVNLPIFIHNG